MNTRSTNFSPTRNAAQPDFWDRPAALRRSPREDALSATSTKVRPNNGVLSAAAPSVSPHDNVHDFAAARRRRELERLEEERQIDAQQELNVDLRAAAQRARYEQKRKRVDDRRQRVATRRAQCPACHWGLFVLTTLLALLSIPIVYSASTPVALSTNHAADFFFWRQVVFVSAGYLLFLGVSRLDRHKTRILVWGLYCIALLGLLAIDLTPLGVTQHGVRRWIKLPILPPQQFSELAKIALVGVMADFWSRAAPISQRAKWPWLVTAGLTLPMVGLVFVQPHLSAALLLFALPFVIAIYAGAPMRHIVGIGVPLLLCAALVVVLCKSHAMPGLKEYQQERIAAHFAGGANAGAQGSNYQKLQSERTLMSGGIFGRGPADSLGKQGHLPEPHTDFIFAVIGEEYGLVGALGLLLAYGAMIFFCFHIGHCAESDFESLLCAGVGTLLAIQVTCNIGVATGMLPVTGMGLPFLSYGGSGLICMMVGVAMVLGVSRQTSRSAQQLPQN